VNADHLKTSISSATSGSTDSTGQRNTYPQSYQYHADAERGYGSDPRSRSSYLSPAASQRQSHGRHAHREMVQAPPETVIRYIRQDVDDDGEEDEPADHAIWILVGLSSLWVSHI
jgi:hypothetical protein